MRTRLAAVVAGVALASVLSIGVVTPAHASSVPAAAPTANVITDLWDNAVYVTSEILADTYGKVVGDPAKAFNDAAARGRRGAQGANSHNNASGSTPDKARIPTGLGSGVIKGVGAAADAVGNYSLGTSLGQWGLSWFGIDANQTVCANTSSDPMGVLWRTLSGNDCDAFEAAESYVPDMDIVPMGPGWRENKYIWVGNWGATGTGSPTGAAGSFVFQEQWQMTTQTSTAPFGVVCQNSVTKAYYQLGIVGNVGLNDQTWSYNCNSGGRTNGVLVAMGRITGTTGYAVDIYTIRQEEGSPAYFTPLSENYRPGVTADPDRTYECTTTYADGSKSVGTSPAFKESSGSFGNPACPAAVVPAGSPPKVVDKVTVKDNVTQTIVYNNTTSTVYKDLATTQPSCLNGSCVLNLKVKATGKSCFDLGDVCKDWLDHKTDYQCSYGSVLKGIESCYIYGNTFDRNKVAAGNGYSDPATGNDTQSNTSPGVDQAKMNRPVRPNAQDRDCFGSGWASVANPLDWVMVPVNCSLEWAFVPRDVVVKESMYGAGDAWDETPPGKLGAFVTGLSADLPVLDGCEGPHLLFDINLTGWAPWARIQVDSYPLSACDAPWSLLAAAARIIGGLFMIWGAIRASSRYLGGIIGFAEIGKGA